MELGTFKLFHRQPTYPRRKPMWGVQHVGKAVSQLIVKLRLNSKTKLVNEGKNHTILTIVQGVSPTAIAKDS